MAGRLDGKRVILTDPGYYSGPGIIKGTYFSEQYRQTEDFRRRMTEVPAGRLASMEELAKTVLFLAGPESDFFYGQVIPFAGGWAV
jgi:NAD(P)-dependent dehydrogenase (short-subunit alcohol dehydrogenase family)